MLFLAGAVLCLLTVMPVDFYLPGHAPKDWDKEVTSGAKFPDCLGELADHMQEYIEDNDKAINANAKKFKWGASFGIAAPFIGVPFGCWFRLVLGLNS